MWDLEIIEINKQRENEAMCDVLSKERCKEHWINLLWRNIKHRKDNFIKSFDEYRMKQFEKEEALFELRQKRC